MCGGHRFLGIWRQRAIENITSKVTAIPRVSIYLSPPIPLIYYQPELLLIPRKREPVPERDACVLVCNRNRHQHIESRQVVPTFWENCTDTAGGISKFELTCICASSFFSSNDMNPYEHLQKSQITGSDIGALEVTGKSWVLFLGGPTKAQK